MAVSIRDVARHAGVTIGTISRALNGYEDIRPETRQKILDAVKELGYVPNVSARSLSAKRPPNVALIISGLLEVEPKDNLSYLLLQGIYGYAQANGWAGCPLITWRPPAGWCPICFKWDTGTS